MLTNEFLKKFPTDRTGGRRIRPRIYCKDGWNASIQASFTHYCSPEKDNADHYTHVEVGYISEEEEKLIPYAEDKDWLCNTVYGYVPVEILDDVLKSHGEIIEYDGSPNFVYHLFKGDHNTTKIEHSRI